MLNLTPRRREPSTPPAGRQRQDAAPHSHVAVPEWMTEECKHRVEAEARGRLKRQIRGVGARR